MSNGFQPGQVCEALDAALIEQPALVDHFSHVEIILLDRPNFLAAKHYLHDGKIRSIASRYLRKRAGDALHADISKGQSVFCYTYPAGIFQVISEYYANIHCSHFSSVIWHALSDKAADHKKVMFYLLSDDAMTVMQVKDNQLVFNKQFRLRAYEDAVYYLMACKRMLQPDMINHVTIETDRARFGAIDESVIRADHQIHLPSIEVLFTQYKACVS